MNTEDDQPAWLKNIESLNPDELEKVASELERRAKVIRLRAGGGKPGKIELSPDRQTWTPDHN